MSTKMALEAQISVYGKPLCGDCDSAKGVFAEVNVPYTYRDINAEPEAKIKVANICKALGRDPAVPVIVIRQETDEVNAQIVFIEPRGLALRALASTLLALRK